MLPVVLPFAVLVLLCSTSAPYREFYASAGGLLVILAGSAMALATGRVDFTLLRVFMSGEEPFTVSVEATADPRRSP